MKALPPEEGAAITIVDSKGVILACTSTDLKEGPCKTVSSVILRKTHDTVNGSLEETGADGIERLYSFAHLTRTGWRVIAGVPRELAYHEASVASTRYIVVLSVVSLAALVFSFAGLTEIEKGNLATTVKLSGHDELQDVAASFNRMAITRHEFEQKLRDSESFRAAVLDGIGEGVVVVGKDYRILSANQSYCNQVNMSCEEIIGKHCYKLSHHLDQPCFMTPGGCDCTVQKCFETGEHHRSMHTHYDKDDNPRYIDTNAHPLKDSSGAVIAAIETMWDVTDIVNLEKQLSSVKDRYRKLYDDAPDMMHSCDRTGKIIICNKTEANALGYAPEELVGRPQADIIAPDERDACIGKMASMMNTGFYEGERTLIAKDGRRIPVFVRAKAMYDENGAFLMTDAILRDITEKKNLEAQLLQAQKMEAVGLLAGGVAHDFNNVLTAVVGYGTLLLAHTERDPVAHTYVERVLSAAERATNLTRSLLAFSRKQIINPRPVRLGEMVTNLEKILTKVIGEDIELRVFVSPHEASVMADTGQIDQALMNLATNARDAMPEGGVLIIETELVEFDEDYVRRHAFAEPGKYMLISMTDTGQGIDAKTREKIFEPFFTTKDVGKGTGLGLSMVYGIVKQHNGHINVYSEPGKGTTFKIYFPVVQQEAEQIETVVLPPVVGGSETILIAEDAVIVSDLAKNILDEFGYRVIVAKNGLEAVELYKANPGVALLILDVVMPGKNGKETFAEIRSMRSDMKAIFMSGYTANIIHKKGILDVGTEFISKPFSPGAFLRKVREVLDNGTPAA
jgi:PAS domain S-box-containing protein